MYNLYNTDFSAEYSWFEFSDFLLLDRLPNLGKESNQSHSPSKVEKQEKKMRRELTINDLLKITPQETSFFVFTQLVYPGNHALLNSVFSFS